VQETEPSLANFHDAAIRAQSGIEVAGRGCFTLAGFEGSGSYRMLEAIITWFNFPRPERSKFAGESGSAL